MSPLKLVSTPGGIKSVANEAKTTVLPSGCDSWPEASPISHLAVAPTTHRSRGLRDGIAQKHIAQTILITHYDVVGCCLENDETSIVANAIG